MFSQHKEATGHGDDRQGYPGRHQPEDDRFYPEVGGKRKLSQVDPVLGAEDDPHLPAGKLDAILVVDFYHEMRKYDAMMRSFRRALKAGGDL